MIQGMLEDVKILPLMQALQSIAQHSLWFSHYTRETMIRALWPEPFPLLYLQPFQIPDMKQK